MIMYATTAIVAPTAAAGTDPNFEAIAVITITVVIDITDTIFLFLVILHSTYIKFGGHFGELNPHGSRLR